MLITPLSRLLYFFRNIENCVAIFTDLFLSFFSVYLSFYLRLGEWINPFSSGYWRILFFWYVSIIISFPLFVFFGLYQEILRYSSRHISYGLLKSFGVSSVLTITLFVFIGFDGVPRTIGFIQPIVFLLLLISFKTIVSYCIQYRDRNFLASNSKKKILIYGAGEAGRQLKSALDYGPRVHVVGFLDDNPKLQNLYLLGKRVYSPQSLIDLARSNNIDGVLIAIPSCTRLRRKEIIDFITRAKLAVYSFPSLNDLMEGRIIFSDTKEFKINDLLGRSPVKANFNLLSKKSFQKKILITGGGGSIGSELCRQVLELDPSLVILIDQSEFSLYQIGTEIKKSINSLNKSCEVVLVLGSVSDANLIRALFGKWRPDIIYHAAAYKHVPLVELNILEGIRNNVMGTLLIANAAIEYGVENFVLISTDKAVRPSNVMGATKRIAEMILQGLAQQSSDTIFSIVRFGNVLGSSGSVVPKFLEQIKSGGPVTITDFRITRYFMTIPEAAQLVIQSSALAHGGDIFLLDMGEPVKILDLALRMIGLSGLEVKNQNNPLGDIEIAEIGIRKGEKLYEELLIADGAKRTSHPRIYRANEEFLCWEKLEPIISELNNSIGIGDVAKALNILQTIVIGFKYCDIQDENNDGL